MAVKLHDGGVFLINGTQLFDERNIEGVRAACGQDAIIEEAKKGTIAYAILSSHNTSGDDISRYYVCRHCAAGTCFRHGGFSFAVCPDRMP